MSCHSFDCERGISQVPYVSVLNGTGEECSFFSTYLLPE